MPQGQTIDSVMADPGFRALSPEAQKIVLGKIDSKFASLSPEAQGIVMQRLGAGGPPDLNPTPPAPKGFFDRTIDEERQKAQQESYKAFGPESEGRSLLQRAASAGKSLYHEATGTVAQIEKGFTDPKQLAIMATGLFDPAIPAAYYGTQAIAGLTGVGQPSSVKTAINNPTPENVQAPLLQGATLAGSGAAIGVPGAGAAVEAAKAIPEAARRGLQEGMFIGPSLTEREQAKVDTSNKKLMEEHQDRLQEFKDNSEALRRNDIQRYNEKVAKIQQQNAAEAAEHKQTVDTINALNTARRTQVGQRAQLVNDVTNNGALLATKLKDLEKNVRAEGSTKFDVVTKAIGDEPANPVPLRNAVNYAKKNILAGSPENIKIFDSILNDTKPDLGPVETSMGKLSPEHPLYQRLQAEGALPQPETIGFRDLQGYYTELGQRIGTRDLPGDVYRALKYVREEGIGKEMEAMASKHGVSKQLADARAFWRDYSQTFHDMRAVGQGGSPIARSYRAIDPDFAIAPFVGKAGLRAIQQLQRYSPELANVAKETVAKANQVKTLPKNYVEKPVPEAPTPKPLFQVAEISTIKPPKAPEYKTIDPQALKQRKIQEIADKARGEGGWGLYSDIGAVVGAGHELLKGNAGYAAGLLAYPLTRRFLGAALERPSIMNWLSKPSAGDFGIRTAPQQFHTPLEVMMAAKEGRLSPQEAARITQQMKGRSAAVTRPIRPAPPPP